MQLGANNVCKTALLGPSIPLDVPLCILIYAICQLFKESKAVSGAKDSDALCVTLIMSPKNKTDIQFR